MKRSKKRIWIILGVILPALVIGTVCIGLRVVPTVNHALRISELLQPVTEAKNQTMHIAVSAKVKADTIALDSDVYMITEDDIRFLALEQRGTTLYITDNVLFLENGKAFSLGEKMQTHAASFETLLPRIGALYEALKITAEETDGGTLYEITVTVDQVETLLAAASLGEALPTEGIETLKLRLTERNGKLDQIQFFGSGTADSMVSRLDVTLSDFRLLAPGDYPIPEAVKHSAATVNPDELFSLTEDLYRLVPALAPFADMESMDGTLTLTVDCGLIQLDTQLRLSDLQTSSVGQIDSQQLRALPEMLGLVCMEGNITCTRQGNSYVYELELDRQTMQKLAQMILPELGQYGSNLTKGSVTIILENNAVTSMNVSIEGKLNALITQIPVHVSAEFSFD